MQEYTILIILITLTITFLAILVSGILVSNVLTEDKLLFSGLGFSEATLEKDCAVYQTISFETDIVDKLIGIPPSDYTCQDGSLQALEKVSSVCQEDNCKGYDGRIYSRNQKQYYYRNCISYSMEDCPTLGQWAINNGNCLNLETGRFEVCGIQDTLLYDQTLRVSGKNACLNSNLSLGDCTKASNWTFSQGKFCAQNGICLQNLNNQLTVTSERDNASVFDLRFARV